MIIFITGASHTGKTALAQKLLKKLGFPYLSIDHLKMGLIRSGNTNLTPLSDDSDLTSYLWPIVSEIAKTAIENKQNLIIEGCYIPPDWKSAFTREYLSEIRFICLLMSEKYIKAHFDTIKKYANIIEKRLCDDFTEDEAIVDNAYFEKHFPKEERFLIDEDYSTDELIEKIGGNFNNKETEISLPEGYEPLCGELEDGKLMPLGTIILKKKQ